MSYKIPPNQFKIGGFITAFGVLSSISSGLVAINSGNPFSLPSIIFYLGIFLLIFGIFLISSDRFYNKIIDIVFFNCDRIRFADASEAEKIHAFAESCFGESITDANKIREIIKKYKKSALIALKNKNGNENIIGYVFFFPINKGMVDKIKKFEFDVRDISESDISTKVNYGYAIYIGAIASNNFFARGHLLNVIRSYEGAAGKTKSKTVYARAATRDGLRLLKRSGFSPVHKEAPGINCFFYKTY